MTEEKIKERIAKLLALGRNNPNEHEADIALRRAAAMMAEHGIKEKEVTGSRIELGGSIDIDKMWKKTLCNAAATLYGTVPFWSYEFDSVQFTGQPSHVEATMETFIWLVDQVEHLYKLHLPRGLSQQDRAHHRRKFKDACANRTLVRVRLIMESLQQEKIPGTQLVVLSQIKQDEAKAQEFLEIDMKSIKQKRRTVARVDYGSASALIGMKAADTIQLNKKVKS